MVFVSCLVGCVSKRFEPVSEDSLRRNPSERPSYTDTLMTSQKYSSANLAGATFGLNQISRTCSSTVIGVESEDIVLAGKCTYQWTLKVRFYCGIQPAEGMYFEVPARSKDIDLNVTFAGENSKIVKPFKGTTDTSGSWQTSIQTTFVPASATATINGQNNNWDVLRDGSINLGEDSCTRKK